MAAWGPATAPKPSPPPAPAPPKESIITPKGALLAGEDTYGVIAGVLTFAEPGVNGWSAEMRKDQELYQVLRARGVPADHIELLLDHAATHENVAAALARIAKRAPAGATLFFYYAGHGTRDGSGKPYFLAYDTQSGALPATGIAVSGVADSIVENFSGKRVVLMADCCYSGTLKDAADTVAEKKKIAAASITSADASNLSTVNWTFTQTVIDALRGDGLMDQNGDRSVDLAELDSFVADEMKYRELQRHGFHLRGVPEHSPLAVATPVERGSGPFEAGSYVRAAYARDTRVAQVRRAGAKKSLVRFYKYNHSEDQELDNSGVQRLRFRRYPVGAKLKVTWGGKLWDAKVLKTDGDFHYITYPGWPHYWDEWVMSDRIRP